jgi:hypothetical protein
MADDQSTTTTDDTSVSEDTSTTEESQDTEVIDFDSDNLFDDIEVDSEDTEDSEDDSEQEDSAQSEDTDEPEESEEDVAEEAEDTEAEAEPQEKPAPDPDAMKRHNDEMAKARIEARKAREEAESLRRETETANIERYLREAENDDAEYQQRLADVRAYQNKEEQIHLNAEKLETRLERAVNSIDLFKNGTEAVRERLLRAVDLFEQTSVVKDERGRPVEVKGDIYKYLQEEAHSIEQLLGDGARQQEQQKQTQKARTVAPPARAPKQKKVDPGLEGFDEEANRVW